MAWSQPKASTFTATARSPREALPVPVRPLAFPAHVLLQFAPAPALEAFGLFPAAPWRSSAAVVVALGLPLWGVLVCGALVIEAWLGMVWKAAGRRR